MEFNKRVAIVDAFMAVILVALIFVIANGQKDYSKPVVKNMITVVVDAGHGGFDGGAKGTDTGVIESGLNLEVANKLRSALEKEGFLVIMTREDENAIGSDKSADMKKRKEIINGENVDYVISIHMNKFSDRAVSGPMAFYQQGSIEGEKLAVAVINGICESVDRPKRIANPGDYYMIRESPAVSVLVECGFLSNSTDEKLLQDSEYQDKIVTGIVNGFKEYLGKG